MVGLHAFFVRNVNVKAIGMPHNNMIWYGVQKSTLPQAFFAFHHYRPIYVDRFQTFLPSLPCSPFLPPLPPPRIHGPTRCSFIRKAMVSTIFRAMQERNPGIAGYSGGFYDDGERGGRRDGAMVPTAGGTSGMLPGGEDGFATESTIESAAAACVLWSTVGVGCLIAGRPKSSVSLLLDCRRGLSVPNVCSGVDSPKEREVYGGPFPKGTTCGCGCGCGMARCFRGLFLESLTVDRTINSSCTGLRRTGSEYLGLGLEFVRKTYFACCSTPFFSKTSEQFGIWSRAFFAVLCLRVYVSY